MGEVAIRVITRARRPSIDGEQDDPVILRVSAPPVEGAANASAY